MSQNLTPVERRPELLAPTAFSTGKVFVMWDLRSILIKAKDASAMDLGAQVRLFLTTHGYTGEVEMYASYSNNGGVPGALVAEVRKYFSLLYHVFNSDYGPESELDMKISELMAENAGTLCTFVLISSNAWFKPTLVRLSNAGFHAIVVFNRNNVATDYLDFISCGRFRVDDASFFSLP